MVTANFLGTDEGAVDIEDMEDSLKELANMVGGSFLAQSSDKNWRMGIPHVQRTCSGAERGGCPDAELAFSLFGDPVGAVSVRFGQIA
jgi:hypothetical protein